MAFPCSPMRELAQRESLGTQVTLLWREGTRKLWVEISELALDITLTIPVPPERALDAFHHPYAYAGHRRNAPGDPLAA